MVAISSLSVRSENVDETVALGKLLGDLLVPGSVVLLSGDLGAGKTQLTKGVAAALGVVEAITSPTFNIMYEHVDATSAIVLRHFDLYRLDDEAELDDIDYFGLLEDEAVSVVEWGDKFPDALPAEYLMIRFGYGRTSGAGDAAGAPEPARILEFSAVGDKAVAVLQALNAKVQAQQGSATTNEIQEQAR